MIESKKRWRLTTPDNGLVQAIQQELSISSVLAKILVTRGITTAEEARSFMNMDESGVHNPYLMKDMDIAVERIRRAIEENEKIVVYGDYDADGVSSTTVMLTVLQDLGADVSFMIPNRFKHGYGPNKELFKKASEEGAKLLVTVDNGISGIDEVDYANSLGLDVIISDHHDIGETMPNALAIIHPRHPEGNYPFGELAGVGVAFKMAHALYEDLPDHLLEMVAIGTIADLVPLHDENRFLVKEGLAALRTSPRVAIDALCEVSGVQKRDITEETIGFMFGPRINAIGRLQDADPAVRLFMTEEAAEARDLASSLDLLNKERQAIVKQISDEATAQVDQQHPEGPPRVIVVAQEGWNPGVVGIVASKLTEKYYRPSIVLCLNPETGKAKGSARSIEGFHLYNELAANRDILPHFGGHPMAAGMTLEAAHVDELRERLNKQAETSLTEEDLLPVVEIDIPVRLDEIDIETIESMRYLAPFGMGFSKPKFFLDAVKVSSIRKIGAAQNHLKMELVQNAATLDAVGFGIGSVGDELTPDVQIDVIGDLQINEWNGRKKPQLLIEDVRTDQWQLFDIRGIRQVSRWSKLIPEKDQVFLAFKPETAAVFKSFINEPIYSSETIGALDSPKHHLVLLDLPDSEEQLAQVLSELRPKRIYAHFYAKDSQYFEQIPTREQFAWLFSFIKKRGSFDFKKHCDELAKHKGWTREAIFFMLQVFFELGFVTLNNGLTEIAKAPSKRDLSEAPIYKKREQQIALEQKLLYASYKDLKEWFDTKLSAKEEKIWI
ncbi:single-stranded-DNA-specific exonuclease RecJ [Planomicrobium sp. CPCC 101110]|uniref:single-stranded-DNA-specific exonuclease RecJ n=1 Tax=Planomicrobium sp. CPCC 101110 TaxID=2599619 RepID=UPI0011B4F7EE|nr:single-stranded-DNA-specific exonuclease RecJ [Planomicrobium sp. CPCC 101110]TWT26240.1 single-stranded-DNA-specific exonuclease RecJ [Planomicrobium sp. CPCC 101110]